MASGAENRASCDLHVIIHQPLVGRVELTPVLLTAGVANLVYVYCFFLSRALWSIGGAVAALAMIALGPTPEQMLAWADAGWNRACEVADGLMPRTAMQWGLLALGAAVSLRKEPVVPVEEKPSSA